MSAIAAISYRSLFTGDKLVDAVVLALVRLVGFVKDGRYIAIACGLYTSLLPYFRFFNFLGKVLYLYHGNTKFL
jgi:hypothetical protein